MFKLIFSMATSNLKKNHSLYLPYALTTIMVTMILYITHALSAMPELSTLRGGGAIAQTLGFGSYRGSARSTLNDSLRECLRDEKSIKRIRLI